MIFARPDIKTEVTLATGGFIIRLSSDQVARAVDLYGLPTGFFRDNYFDLLPDRPVGDLFPQRYEIEPGRISQRA